METKETNIAKSIPPCEKKEADISEFLRVCNGVYPASVTYEKFLKDEKRGVLSVSVTENRKWINFCLWEGENKQKLVARFSIRDFSAIQLASLLSPKPQFSVKKS